jgi:hypothetical protein
VTSTVESAHLALTRGSAWRARRGCVAAAPSLRRDGARCNSTLRGARVRAYEGGHQAPWPEGRYNGPSHRSSEPES